MYIYSTISFLVSASYLCLGVFAFAKGKNRYVNWVFLLLCSSLYLLAFPFTFFDFVSSNSGGYIFLILTICIGTCLYPAFFLHLALLITNRVNDNDKYTLSIYVPQILVIFAFILYLFTFKTSSDFKLLMNILKGITITLYNCIAIVLFWTWGKKSKSKTETKQAVVIVICSIITTICQISACFIYEYSRFPNTFVGHVFPIIMALGFWYAISALGFMNIENCISVYELLDKSNDFVIVMDLNGRIIKCNNKVIFTLGYTKRELSGKSIGILMPEIFKYENEQEEILSDISNSTIEGNLYKKDKEKIPVRLLVSVINYRDDLIGYVIVAQDIPNILLLKQEISERRLTEKQLMELMASNKRLLEETLEYDQLKTEFFSNISHELKTPLNVLLSAIQLSEYYLNNKSPIDISKLIKNNHYMKQNCFRLLKLISNLLDVTKIDSGYFKVNNVNADIIYFIENIIDSIQPYTDEKQINVYFDTNIEDKMASFDPYIIETIILNLLSNALKFTPPKGTILVNVTSTDEIIEVIVEDNGVGIPDDKLEIIFERFRQVTPLLTRKHEGSGIGLSLVKSLIEILNGTIDVQSRAGQGTKFIIRIPYILDDKCITINDIQDYTQNFTTNNIDRVLIQFSDIPLESQ